ncbi:MAG: hypothetical protein U5J83_12680 [Bryobacterales bacterium]|nr:hypothetical protein [Bryobacterales bacterium]
MRCSSINPYLGSAFSSGLSDGARIDVFRRANVGRISNEQVVLTTEINRFQVAACFLKDLRASLKDPTARFRFVFLLDDFVGTGTTLLRKEEDRWKGRLPKVRDRHSRATRTGHFESDLLVIVHHYIATAMAKANIDLKLKNRSDAELPELNWLPNLQLTYGLVLPIQFECPMTVIPSFMTLLSGIMTTRFMTSTSG